jgi:multidrug resistance protein, MATE family
MTPRLRRRVAGAARSGAVPGGSAEREHLLAESRTLLAVAAPIILSQLGSVGMNTMDTIMVGPLGAEALAAVGLAGALHWGLLMITTGTLFGMGPLVSQSFGAGDRSGCRRVLLQGLWIAAFLAVPMFAVNAIGERIALLVGQDPAISGLVGGYMWALAWGVLPLLLFMAFRQYLEGMSLTKPAMVITFVGLGVNFIGNSVFIYGAGGFVEPMGAIGSGWATTLVRWAMLVAMIGYVISRADLHPFRHVSLRLDPRLLETIVRIGAPAGLQIAAEVSLFTIAAIMMGWFGPVELGTHQVTINIAATTFMLALGVSLAGSIRVGQRIGAGDQAGTRRVVLLTYGYASAAMGATALMFLLIPETLLRLYTQDPEIIKLGASLLFMAALFQIFDGTQAAGFSVLRGAADTRIPMLIAMFAYWGIGIPSMYLLGFHSPLGPAGVWAGLVVGLAAATALLSWRVRVIHWQRPLLRQV